MSAGDRDSVYGSGLSSGLPEGEEEKLQAAFRIIQQAFFSKVTSMQDEIAHLRQNIDERQRMFSSQQKRLAQAEIELIDIKGKYQALVEENSQSQRIIKSQRAQIEHLEKLKKSIAENLEIHFSVPDSVAASASTPTSSNAPRAFSDPSVIPPLQLSGQSSNAFNGRIASSSASVPPDFYNPAQPQPSFKSSSESSSFSSTAFNKVNPTQMSNYLNDSSADPSSYNISSQQFMGANGMSSIGGRASSASSLGSGNGGTSGSVLVDGKKFFKEARERLDVGSFNAFLSSIKRLNNQKQSRDDTLEDAHKIFGEQHYDLFETFKTLISRHP